MAKMLVPETGVPATEGKVVIPKTEEHQEENLIGAIARGTIDGGKLALKRRDHAHQLFGAGGAARYAARLGPYACRVPLDPRQPRRDTRLPILAGGMAYWYSRAGLQLDRKPARHAHGSQRSDRLYRSRHAQGRTLLPRSFTIATFALCGFANLGSIGMQIGGIGALVPERRNDLAKLGVRAMLAGTMANLISASIAGMFLG